MEEWVDAFLLHLQNKNFSALTVKSYRADLAEFLAFCKQRGINNTGQFTSALIRTFLAALQTQHQPARNTILRKIASLRSFAAYLLETGELMRNPFRRPSVKKYFPNF